MGESFIFVYEDRAGTIWLGGGSSRLSRHDGISWSAAWPDTLASAVPLSMVQDRAGVYWFDVYWYDDPCGGTAMLRYDGSPWRRIAVGATDDSGRVCGAGSLAVDGAEHLWVSTWVGAARFVGVTWVQYRASDGRASNHVATTFASQDGKLWFGTDRGVTRFDGTIWRTFTTSDGLVDDRAIQIAQDEKGHLWFVTPVGTSIYDGAQWTSSTFGAGAHGIASDGRGQMWIDFGVEMSPRGATRLDGVHGTICTTRDGLPNDQVTGISSDRLGNMLFATFSGAARYDGSEWRSPDCPRCGGAMRILAFVTEPGGVRRILKHLAGRGHDARAGPWTGAAPA